MPRTTSARWNTRFEQIAGLGPEESGKIKTLEELIRATQQPSQRKPAAFAELLAGIGARQSKAACARSCKMMRPSPRILEESGAAPWPIPPARAVGTRGRSTVT